jgi:hypothetical protein
VIKANHKDLEDLKDFEVFEAYVVCMFDPGPGDPGQ